MRIQVLLFASYRDRAQARELNLELPEGASLRAVAAATEERFPGLDLSGGLCARNEEYASPDDPALEGDRVAFFPPVSGGDGPDCLFVTDAPLELPAYLNWASCDGCGAVSSFVGTVRSPNYGQVVTHIDYQGYEAMIRTQMARVAAELRRSHDLYRIVIGHRLGRLFPGEASILIVVSAAHRHDALVATQACIDRCKELLPVWKHEVTEQGSHWVAGHAQSDSVL